MVEGVGYANDQRSASEKRENPFARENARRGTSGRFIQDTNEENEGLGEVLEQGLDIMEYTMLDDDDPLTILINTAGPIPASFIVTGISLDRTTMRWAGLILAHGKT